MKNFSFDEWRLRYMKWHNHKKSRVNDFFRHQDKDHDGKLTRKEFIDGILGRDDGLRTAVVNLCELVIGYYAAVENGSWLTGVSVL